MFSDITTPEQMDEAVGSLQPDMYEDFFEMEANRTAGEIITEARKIVRDKEEYMKKADLKSKPIIKSKKK